MDGRDLCLFKIVVLGFYFGVDEAAFFLEWALGLRGVEL